MLDLASVARAWALVRALVKGDCKICKKFAKLGYFALQFAPIVSRVI